MMSSLTKRDKEKFMQRCIQLAKSGKLHAAPNPMVGAVIVHNHKIIGEGYHIKGGSAHAEVNAIQAVEKKELLPQSTIFVSLEPCSHTGKTPPCADLIIESGIPQVIIGCQDPFSQVAGNGIKKLQQAGILVEVGILEEQCKQLIRRFYTFHSKKRPYILLKWAQSADFFLDKIRDTGRPTILSTPLSSLFTHKRRAEVSAILVGRKTALLDNPSLTTRHWYPKHPIRLVIDRNLSLPHNLHLFDGKVPTIVFTAKREQENRENLEYISLDFTQDIIPQLLATLYKRNIQSILVEGGSTLLQSFIKCNLWDEIHIEQSQKLIGQGVPSPQRPNNSFETCKLLGSKFMLAHAKQ